MSTNTSVNSLAAATTQLQSFQSRLSAGSTGLGGKEQQYLAGQIADLGGQLTNALVDGKVDAGELGNIGKELSLLNRDTFRLEHNFRGADMNGKQANMLSRMAAGGADKSLTGAESDSLRAAMSNIETQIASAQADGTVDCCEANAIKQAQRELSHEIFAARHNSEGVDNTPKTIDGATAELKNQLASGTADGSLSADAQSTIAAKIQEIESMAANARSDRFVNPEEQRSIRSAQRELQSTIAALRTGGVQSATEVARQAQQTIPA